MKTLNHSKQREAIKDFLITRKDHPTAAVIYENVKKAIPNISLGTVYRNLNLLADIGSIRRVRGINDIEHYDADTSPHQHFICKSCGEVSDIFLNDKKLLDNMNAAAGKDFPGSILSNDIYFYGLCKDCSINRKDQ